MQPYPPPAQAAYQVAAPAPVHRRRAGLLPSSVTGRDAAVLLLLGVGIALVLLSAASPWFQLRAETVDRDGRSYAVVNQDYLIPEQTSGPESRLGLSIFIILLGGLVCAVACLVLSGWLALNRWRAKPAFVLFVGMVPMILCLLAPVFHYQYLPDAKMEAARDYMEVEDDTYQVPTGPSPHKSFYGSGEDVRIYQYEENWGNYYDADRAAWGGGIGFYLSIAASFVFLAAFILMMANTWRALKERARTGA